MFSLLALLYILNLAIHHAGAQSLADIPSCAVREEPPTLWLMIAKKYVYRNKLHCQASAPPAASSRTTHASAKISLS